MIGLIFQECCGAVLNVSRVVFRELFAMEGGAMEPLRPIFWGQGMFLQPQHFQQQDCYHEARLRYYLQLLSPFCWGVQALSINEMALRNFLVEVERCELITSEGTPVRFQGASLPSNARITPRSCEGALVPD